MRLRKDPLHLSMDSSGRKPEEIILPQGSCQKRILNKSNKRKQKQPDQCCRCHNIITITLIIITVAGSIVLRAGAMLLWGSQFQSFPAFSGENPIWLIPRRVSIVPQDLWVWGTLAAVTAGLALFFRLTVTGKAMRACADNREAAQLMGIEPARMVFLAFVLSAAMAAVAGIVAAPTTTVKYDMGAMLALKGFCAAVVGGLGNFPGAVMAGLLLGVAEKLASYFISSHYEHAIALVALLVVLVVMPGGIAGRRRGTVRAGL